MKDSNPELLSGFFFYKIIIIGGLAERFKAPVSKTGWGAIPSQVQILYPPQI